MLSEKRYPKRRKRGRGADQRATKAAHEGRDGLRGKKTAPKVL